MLLDSIGVTRFYGQVIVPDIATLKSNQVLSGAINFFPAHINLLIDHLRKGVVKGGLAYTLAERLKVLTDIEWEDAQYVNGGKSSDVQSNQPAMVKLTEKSYKSLYYPDKWITDDQISLFKNVCSTLKLVRESNIKSGLGNENQLVQLVNSKFHDTVEFYVMDNIPNLNLGVAVAFGFGHHDHELEQVSRYLGSSESAFRRGTSNPKMIRKLLCSEHYGQLWGGSKHSPSHVLTVFVPITFHNIPAFVRRVWERMSCIGGRLFQRRVTEENYKIFLKSVLLMCQAKLVYAHRAMPFAKPACSNLMYESTLTLITSSASNLPEPIAVLLDSIGITKICSQDVVPVIAKLKSNPELSGAINLLPADVNLLVDKLKNGVVKEGLEHTFGKKLEVLAKVEWESVLPMDNKAQSELVRLTEKSCKSLYFHDKIMTENQFQLFKNICNSFAPKMHTCDVKSGQGMHCQLVQFTNWKADSTVDFYVMENIADGQLKLAATFGFGHHEYEVQSSRFMGSPETALKTGNCNQSQVSNSIVSLLSVDA
jgi:hypothetical protein